MTPRLLVRLWVAGALVVEEEITWAEAPGQAAAHHAVTVAAEEAGKAWRLEITDPDGDIEDTVMTWTPD